MLPPPPLVQEAVTPNTFEQRMLKWLAYDGEHHYKLSNFLSRGGAWKTGRDLQDFGLQPPSRLETMVFQYKLLGAACFMAADVKDNEHFSRCTDEACIAVFLCMAAKLENVPLDFAQVKSFFETSDDLFILLEGFVVSNFSQRASHAVTSSDGAARA